MLNADDAYFDVWKRAAEGRKVLSFGLNEFSVSAGSVLRTRKIISEWTKEEADALTEKVMKLETSNEVRAMLQAAVK